MKITITCLDADDCRFVLSVDGRLIGIGCLNVQAESIEWTIRPKVNVRNVNGTVDDPDEFDYALVNMILQLSAYEFVEIG